MPIFDVYASQVSYIYPTSAQELSDSWYFFDLTPSNIDTLDTSKEDGVPFPVDRKTMDESTDLIKSGVEQAKIGDKDRLHAIKRLNKFINYNS